MSGTNSDLRQVALQYREKLKSELEKVDRFLDLADEISRSNETFSGDSQTSDGSEPLELHQDPVNVFRESG